MDLVPQRCRYRYMASSRLENEGTVISYSSPSLRIVVCKIRSFLCRSLSAVACCFPCAGQEVRIQSSALPQAWQTSMLCCVLHIKVQCPVSSKSQGFCRCVCAGVWYLGRADKRVMEGNRPILYSSIPCH